MLINKKLTHTDLKDMAKTKCRVQRYKNNTYLGTSVLCSVERPLAVRSSTTYGVNHGGDRFSADLEPVDTADVLPLQHKLQLGLCPLHLPLAAQPPPSPSP